MLIYHWSLAYTDDLPQKLSQVQPLMGVSLVILSSVFVQEGEEEDDGDETVEKESGDNDAEDVHEVTNEKGAEKQTDAATKNQADITTEAKTNCVAEKEKTEMDTADDNALADKVNEMINEKEGDDLIDLDNNGLLEDVS